MNFNFFEVKKCPKAGFELGNSDLNARVLTTTLLSLCSGESSFYKKRIRAYRSRKNMEKMPF